MKNIREISVVAVVVTYNRIKILEQCVKALENQKFSGSLTILVVDNCSTDKTQEFCKAKISDEFLYYKTKSNVGGSGGFNLGVKKASNMNFDYVWLMDDDCVPNEDALSNFFKIKEINNDIGFLASKVLWKDDNLCKANIPKRSIWRHIKKFNGPPQKIVIASFVSVLIPLNVVREVGFPIKDFFILSDDYEYTRRISREYDSYYVPNSIVVHLSENNLGADIVSLPEDQFEKLQRMYKNDVFHYSKEGLHGRLFILFRIFYHSFKVILLSKNKKKMRLATIWKGTKEGRNFKPVIETWEND